MAKTVIVTGAAGNMGKAVVKQLLREGHTVIGTILPGENIDDFKNEGNFSAHELDVTNEEGVKDFVDKISTKHENIDMAALLVGGFGMGNIQDTNGGQIADMFKLNFFSAYHMARELFRKMEKQQKGGQIVFIGARPALEAQAGKDTLAYSLSKSLLFNFADILNAEGKDKQIRASVVVPSILDTAVNREGMPSADFSSWVKPENLAEIFSFLLSDAASSLRETVLKVYNEA